MRVKEDMFHDTTQNNSRTERFQENRKSKLELVEFYNQKN